jgi:hypothetical protein
MLIVMTSNLQLRISNWEAPNAVLVDVESAKITCPRTGLIGRLRRIVL